MSLNAADKTRFLQALDDDPEFLQQVRQRLLSADLLELPERFAAFANHVSGFIAETQGFIAEQRQINEEQREFNEHVSGFIAETRGFIAEQRQINEEQREFNEHVSGFIAETRGFIAEQRETNVRFDQFMVEQREHNRTVDTRLDAMDARFDGIDTRLNRMDGRMDNGFGANYEAKAANNLGSIAGRDLRLRRTRVLKALGFPTDEGLGDLIADAEDRGALTEAEVNDLLATDLIAVGRSRDNGHDVYVAAEVSVTVGDQDVERAAVRAGYLGKVTGQATEPAVVGENIEPAQEALARRRQVTVMLLPAS